MKDTIDMLEAIGQDASLRHASPDELAKALADAQASKALTAAVASGDSSRLADEFERVSNQPTETIFFPAHEEEPGEGGPVEVPVPDESVSPA
jgi:hypothetical protein